MIMIPTVPAVHHYGGVFVSVGPDSFDKLDERAAGLGHPVLRPGGEVEVVDHHVVPVLKKKRVYGRRSSRIVTMQCWSDSSQCPIC